MQDDDDDVVFIENDEETAVAGTSTASSLIQVETRPIMQLFERLISNDSKESTVLTNAQIISILEKEFNMDAVILHQLELDIYINIIKRFLKDWPRWEEFDTIINKFKNKKPEVLKEILQEKYNNLKAYLKCIIEDSEPMVKDAVKKLPPVEDKKDRSDLDNVVLEISCSRKQLNELFFNTLNESKTIFNTVTSNPTISLKEFPLDAVLNWMYIDVEINLKCLHYHRSTQHKPTHLLVNTKNNDKIEIQELNTDIQRHAKYSTGNMKSAIQPKAIIIGLLDQIVNFSNSPMHKDMLQTIFKVIKSDLNSMVSSTILVPGKYRQYTNKYPYYRKLYKKIEPTTEKHSVYLRETLSPMHTFEIIRVFNKLDEELPSFLSWLKIKCGMCNAYFPPMALEEAVLTHFRQFHNDEGDWICTNCDKSFPMMELAQKRWYHEC